MNTVLETTYLLRSYFYICIYIVALSGDPRNVIGLLRIAKTYAIQRCDDDVIVHG